MGIGIGPACYIREVATALPDERMDREEGLALLRQGCATPRNARLLERLARLTGIERRNLAVLRHQQPGREEQWLYRPADRQPLGPGMRDRTKAFRALADALVLRAVREISPQALERVDTLITVTCTHAGSPGLEQPILNATRVPSTVDWWNLGFMGCSAALAGLRLAHATAAGGRHVLLVACELSSLHFQYTEKVDQMAANVLFADGAAAVLLSPECSAVRVLACRSVCVTEFAAQMVWTAGDNGLELQLAPELPDTLADRLPGVVRAFLADCRTQPDEIQHWLVHPGGPQVLDAVERSCGLSPEALSVSREILRTHGNMSSPTILFILKETLRAGPRGLALALAFGPGLTIEMVLLRFGA